MCRSAPERAPGVRSRHARDELTPAGVAGVQGAPDGGDDVGVGHPSRDADHQPAAQGEVVVALEVSRPLDGIGEMLLALVLENHAGGAEHEVAADRAPVPELDTSVRLGLGESGTDQQQSRRGLPRGEDDGPDEPACLLQGPSAAASDLHREPRVDLRERRQRARDPMSRSPAATRSSTASRPASPIHAATGATTRSPSRFLTSTRHAVVWPTTLRLRGARPPSSAMTCRRMSRSIASGSGMPQSAAAVGPQNACSGGIRRAYARARSRFVPGVARRTRTPRYGAIRSDVRSRCLGRPSALASAVVNARLAIGSGSGDGIPDHGRRPPAAPLAPRVPWPLPSDSWMSRRSRERTPDARSWGHPTHLASVRGSGGGGQAGGRTLAWSDGAHAR